MNDLVSIRLPFGKLPPGPAIGVCGHKRDGSKEWTGAAAAYRSWVWFGRSSNILLRGRRICRAEALAGDPNRLGINRLRSSASSARRETAASARLSIPLRFLRFRPDRAWRSVRPKQIRPKARNTLVDGQRSVAALQAVLPASPPPRETPEPVKGGQSQDR